MFKKALVVLAVVLTLALPSIACGGEDGDPIYIPVDDNDKEYWLDPAE